MTAPCGAVFLLRIAMWREELPDNRSSIDVFIPVPQQARHVAAGTARKCMATPFYGIQDHVTVIARSTIAEYPELEPSSGFVSGKTVTFGLASQAF